MSGARRGPEWPMRHVEEEVGPERLTLGQ
ncbi:hypothetical protein A2U01_0035681, partial [Trifolium medium]|nr:hypothetical protein [Trifolium medium]